MAELYKIDPKAEQRTVVIVDVRLKNPKMQDAMEKKLEPFKGTRVMGQWYHPDKGTMQLSLTEEPGKVFLTRDRIRQMIDDAYKEVQRQEHQKR